MVDPGGQDEQISGNALDPDPAVVLVADVEVPGARLDQPDLLVRVQMLREKALDLVLVVWQGVLRWKQNKYFKTSNEINGDNSMLIHDKDMNRTFLHGF